jgi:hypothetical protein
MTDQNNRLWNISTVFGGMIANDARCTSEIKCNIAMVKAAFNKKAHFMGKMDIH